MDAKYIKGMINNPDIQPNATINRWIAGILLFDFKLVHVPGKQHGGPDGLSRRLNTEEEEEDEEPEGSHEHWIDDMYCFAQEGNEGEGENPIAPIPYSEEDRQLDQKLEKVRQYLEGINAPQETSEEEIRKFVRYASNFFVTEGRMYRKHKLGHHQTVPKPTKRYQLIRQAHDEMGHKGTYSVWSRL